MPTATSFTGRPRTSVAAREQSIRHQSRRDGEVVATTCGRGDSLHAAWHAALLTKTVLTLAELRACVVCGSPSAICWFLFFLSLCCISTDSMCDIAKYRQSPWGKILPQNVCYSNCSLPFASCARYCVWCHRRIDFCSQEENLVTSSVCA